VIGDDEGHLMLYGGHEHTIESDPNQLTREWTKNGSSWFQVERTICCRVALTLAKDNWLIKISLAD